MEDNIEQEPIHRSWWDSVKSFFNPKVICMLFFGFSSGLPYFLIFASLSLWLNEAGLDKSTVTYFSWAALGFSFKFLWAPLVDQLPVPLVTRLLGKRRAWLLIAQFMVISAILFMAMINPALGSNSLTLMAFAAVFLGFSAATQDILIDAFRIEVVDTDLQTMISSTYAAGYRTGMIVSGAGALILASYLGSEKHAYNYQAWQYTYMIMAALMLIGVAATLLSAEPKKNIQKKSAHTSREYFSLIVVFIISVSSIIATFQLTSEVAIDLKLQLTHSSQSSETFNFIVNKHGKSPLISFFLEALRFILAGIIAISIAMLIIKSKFISKPMIEESYKAPINDFFQRYGKNSALTLLCLISLYKISDLVLGSISNIFYQDLGFSKVEIASIVKSFGLLMTIIGGFFGGILSAHFGVIRILFLGALLMVLTNLLFMLLAESGNDMLLLYFVISADNLSAGLASAAFIAFLSSLVNVSFTAAQYAIFSSLMTLLPKLFSGYTGSIVDSIGYVKFFLFASIMGLPVLLLIWIIHRKGIGADKATPSNNII